MESQQRIKISSRVYVLEIVSTTRAQKRGDGAPPSERQSWPASRIERADRELTGTINFHPSKCPRLSIAVALILSRQHGYQQHVPRADMDVAKDQNRPCRAGRP